MQGENHSDFPLQNKAAEKHALPGKFGRGSLASSHAGTRLPIAAYAAGTQGAPPRFVPGLYRDAEMFSSAPPDRQPKWYCRMITKNGWHHARRSSVSEETPYGGMIHIR